MSVPVTMPVLGLTMEEGTVARWLKREGERVERDEPLLTVEMDKGTVEVPSPAAGVLVRITVQEGQTVPVRTVIAELGESASAPAASGSATPASAGPAASGSAMSAWAAQSASASAPPGSPATGAAADPDRVSHTFVAAQAAGEETPAASVASGPRSAAAGLSSAGASASAGASSVGPSAAAAVSSAGPSAAVAAESAGRGGVFASPRARMRARERGVSLAALTGSGPRGRIVEADVLAWAPSTSAAGRGAERLVATPLARRLAVEQGVDLATVTGSGPGGRITNDDVLAAARASAAPSAPSSPAERGAPSVSAGAEPRVDVQPLSRVRRVTADRMAQSARSVARVTLQLDADLTEAAAFRGHLQPELARLGVPRLPWDALIARAAGLALAEHPGVNAEWVEGHGIGRHDRVHVGVAVALEPEGLVVPVLRDADRRSLRELAADLLVLVDRARASRLSPSEMDGGTFSITNLGQYRIDGFTPIVNPPQAAILGVGRIAPRPAVVGGELVARTLCTFSLSFDHRVVDGAPAAAFLARLAELLERPYALLSL